MKPNCSLMKKSPQKGQTALEYLLIVVVAIIIVVAVLLFMQTTTTTTTETATGTVGTIYGHLAGDWAGICPDTNCDPGENCDTCEADCGPCLGPPDCSDGDCNPPENSVNCPPDCPVHYCGDGHCDIPDENCDTCEPDCGECLVLEKCCLPSCDPDEERESECKLENCDPDCEYRTEDCPCQAPPGVPHGYCNVDPDCEEGPGEPPLLGNCDDRKDNDGDGDTDCDDEDCGSDPVCTPEG